MSLLRRSILLRKASLNLLNQLRLNRSVLQLKSLRYLSFSSNNNLLQNPDVQKYLKFIEEEYINTSSNNLDRSNEAVINLLQKRRIIENDMKSLLAMPCENDEDLKKLVIEEKKSYMNNIDSINSQLINILAPPIDEDRSVIIEVSFGVGGTESMLFTEEIFRMYNKYALYKNWDWLEMETSYSDISMRKGSALVSGKGVFKYLIQEAGIHRVQRVPETEKAGRMHTSTCAVAISPQPRDHEVKIDSKDLSFEYKTAGGAGGQNVNKRETSVRIVHLPTGIAVSCEQERTKEQNTAIALQRLKSTLYDLQLKEENEKLRKMKKSQIGLKMRSDKIRTYNYNQNRITDHRIKQSCNNLPGFLAGGKALDEMICQLIDYDEQERFLQFVTEKLQSDLYLNLIKNEVR